MDIGIDEITDFLKVSYPEYESILVGCRTGAYKSYECCEYDIIVLTSEKNENSLVKKNKYNLLNLHDKNLEVLFYKKENFIHIKEINFQNYINLTNPFFKNNMEDYFEKKKYYNQMNFKISTKRKLLQSALDCTQINKQILNNTIDQNLSSFYIKMMSFNVLELVIRSVSNETPSPSHLKYQINAIKENNPRIKEYIDRIFEYLELDKSNVSIITRSEKSLFFLLKHNKCHHVEMELFGNKLSYFKTNSMYVDGNLLIHSIIKKQNFDKKYIQNYNKLLNYILDIQNKERTILLKELDFLFNFIKYFIKNNY
ncbi:MAG: hypothetical protein M3Z01_04385 [Thermoproteota archaeon]|nr:hypothetical protein [Thermoproteota archaeon]